MVEPFLRLSEADLGPGDFEAVQEALKSRSLSGDGPVGRALEKAMADRLGVRRVLLTTSCSHALETAFLALGLGPEDEVIVPSFTFVSAANAVLRCGARVVFAEIDPRTLNLCPEDTRTRITPHTRAICPTHYAGIPSGLDQFLEMADQNGLAIIEDAAHALGAKYRGKELGTFGLGGCYSFHGTKNIVCGEGGALATDDSDFACQAEIIREKGTNRSAFLRGEVDRYTWHSLGSSYVLSDLLAALLTSQWEKMDRINQRRAIIFTRYLEAFRDLEGERVQLPFVPAECKLNGHLFHALLKDREQRDEAILELRKRGVQASFHFQPLHASPYARRCLGTSGLVLPVTEEVSGRLLRLPLHSGLSDGDVERVIEAFRQVILSR